MGVKRKPRFLPLERTVGGEAGADGIAGRYFHGGHSPVFVLPNPGLGLFGRIDVSGGVACPAPAVDVSVDEFELHGHDEKANLPPSFFYQAAAIIMRAACMQQVMERRGN